MRPEPDYFEETRLGKPYDLKLLRRLTPSSVPRRLLLGSIGLVVLITLLDVALPYVTKLAIDRYIVPPSQAPRTPSGVAAGRALPELDVVRPGRRRAVLQRTRDRAQDRRGLRPHRLRGPGPAGPGGPGPAAPRRPGGPGASGRDLFGPGDFRFPAQLRPVGDHGDHRPADHARPAHAAVSATSRTWRWSSSPATRWDGW